MIKIKYILIRGGLKPMQQLYIIEIHYGSHHEKLETTKKEFYKWIDELSKEFEISKKWKTIEGNNRIKVSEYYVTNYYNEKDLIGTILEY